ncbi:acyl-CoA synthetase [Rhodococcus pyridinivorans]|uniref:acyl-CoA synthetase n=1 Tax=Rhodococcus pyridinivorans TaxID=103816 RepID=UPI0022846227|nr:acyl-CoA synthetase [Rhodococcus pyridinivorans]WAL45879.1 acyl-CoA synthetase [Rhodococcus pyridinivorans]
MYPGRYAAVAPDRPAVHEAATGRTLTYRELEDASVRFAHWLRAHDVGKGDHIAVVTVNDATAFELYWGAVRSGVYVTFVNTHLAPVEAAYIVDDCDAKVLVVSAPLAELAEAIAPLTPKVTHRVAFGGEVPGHLVYEEEVAGLPVTPMADQPRGSDMLYSSGTTGRPKGIKPALSGAQVGDEPGPPLLKQVRRFGFDENTVYLSPAPIYHAAPLRYGVSTQALGGTVVLMERFDPEHSLACIERYRVTHSQWVPTHFVRLLKLPRTVRERYDLSSMQCALHSAAPCPVEVKQELMRWWGEIVYEYYSATEAIGNTLVTPQEWLDKPGTVGKTGGPGTLGLARICDENGNRLPTGEIGTVYFERDDFSFEYHKDPEKTASTRHPFEKNWFTTGDIGYLDEDDYLFLTGRDKFTIISGGVNIYPQEIENVLALHPSIADVAVVGVPDADRGERVEAFVQLVPDVDGSDELEDDIIGFCRERLSRFKCPRHVRFVDELPRTPTGKMVKGTLGELIAQYADTGALS